MKHTPGPWAICKDALNTSWHVGLTIYSEEMLSRICDLTPLRGDQENDANARLIAAAPELLEALETIVPWLIPGMTWDDPLGKAAKDKALDAIAKAKGEA